MIRKSINTLISVSFVIAAFIFTFSVHDKTIENAFLSFAVSLFYTFVIGMGNSLANKFISQKFSWVTQTKVRAILGIVSTLLVSVVLVLLCNYIVFVIIQGENPENFFRGKIAVINWIVLNIALLVSAVLHAKSFIEEWKNASRKEVVEQKIIAKSANAQFESLKNQLDPHFLFNSLNVLSSLIDENTDQAQRFTSGMSKIYRYVLDEKDKELVTVAEEIEFAKTYAELLKTRFEASVNFEFNIDEHLNNAFVVPLSLQLLLENAIKHNYATSQKPLQIRIYSNDNQLIIENNLQQRDIVKEREGIGLSNIVQRYSILTERNVFIEKSPESFKVKIPILKQKITAMNTDNNQEMMTYDKASKRVEQLKSFYGNLISYCIFIPFLFFINWQTSPSYWWAFWPMLGWGIGVLAHGISTFGIGSDWEEKQIRKYMEKEEQSKKWQ